MSGTTYLSGDELRGLADLIQRLNGVDLSAGDVSLGHRLPVVENAAGTLIGWLAEAEGEGWMFEIVDPPQGVVQ